jgi:hypothetical protein
MIISQSGFGLVVALRWATYNPKQSRDAVITAFHTIRHFPAKKKKKNASTQASFLPHQQEKTEEYNQNQENHPRC